MRVQEDPLNVFSSAEKSQVLKKKPTEMSMASLLITFQKLLTSTEVSEELREDFKNKTKACFWNL